jgi:hypothetical protein
MIAITTVGGARFGGRPWLNRRAARMSVFLASILLAAAGSLAALFAYLVPQTPYERIGALADFPPDSEPYYVMTGNGHAMWVVNTGGEMIVFDALTPFSGTRVRFKWVPSNRRFEDPYTGSKFALTGEYIEGPAQRSLDRYAYTVLPDGTVRVDLWQVTPGDRHP